MKKYCITFALLAIIVNILNAQDKKGFFLNVSVGCGISSSAYSWLSAEDFGQDYFSDSSLFKDDSTFHSDLAKRFIIGLDYFISNGFALNIGIGYANRPFSHIYSKNTAQDDYIFNANYEQLQVQAGIKSLFLKVCYLGAGLSYNHVISSDSYEVYGNNAILSPLSMTENNLSLSVDIGSGISISDKNIVFVFIKYQNDLSPIFNYSYDVYDLLLIDLTINIGLSTKL